MWCLFLVSLQSRLCSVVDYSGMSSRKRSQHVWLLWPKWNKVFLTGRVCVQATGYYFALEQMWNDKNSFFCVTCSLCAAACLVQLLQFTTNLKMNCQLIICHQDDASQLRAIGSPGINQAHAPAPGDLEKWRQDGQFCASCPTLLRDSPVDFARSRLAPSSLPRIPGPRRLIVSGNKDSCCNPVNVCRIWVLFLSRDSFLNSF